MARLLENISEGGGKNGVGLTQLTALESVMKAERLGGAHLPANQLKVGFDLLLDNITDLGVQAGAAAYNAGRGNWQSVYNSYGARFVELRNEWKERLA